MTPSKRKVENLKFLGILFAFPKCKPFFPRHIFFTRSALREVLPILGAGDSINAHT